MFLWNPQIKNHHHNHHCWHFVMGKPQERNSPHKGSVKRKVFLCRCVIMTLLWWQLMISWSKCQLPKMTSSNGNIFRVTDHFWGEFTGPRWIPRSKASDAELWWVFFCVWINGWVSNRCSAASDEIVINMATFLFQCRYRFGQKFLDTFFRRPNEYVISFRILS